MEEGRKRSWKGFALTVALLAGLYTVDFFLHVAPSKRAPAGTVAVERHPGYRHLVTRPMVEPWLLETEYLRLPEAWTGAWKTCHATVSEARLSEAETLRQRTNLIGYYYGLSPSPENRRETPGRAGADVSLPLPWGLTSYPGAKLGPNCMLCHGGVDRSGAPNASIANNHLRLHLFLEDVLKVQKGSGVADQQIKDYLRLFGDRGFGSAPGLTTGSTLIHLSMLKRDPESLELRGSVGKFATVLWQWLRGKVHPVSLNTPPLGHVHMKDRLYGAGFIPNDPQAGGFAFSQFLFSSNRAVNDIDREIKASFADVYSWIESLPALPPSRVPGAVAPAVLELGKTIFQSRRCATCHVSSKAQEMRKYTMGTDEALSKQNEQYVNYLRDSKRFGAYVAEAGNTEPGYGARPLNGIAHKIGWLHNGSIPGCEAFVGLMSKPKVWRERPMDPADPKTCASLREGTYTYPDRPTIEALPDWREVERRYPLAENPRENSDWYDTGRYAQSNANPFHEKDLERLTPDQKSALCAYLETL